MVQLPKNMNSMDYVIDQRHFEVGEFTYYPDDFIRDYCGMSGIGEKCLRSLQYSCFRASPKKKVPQRIQRIFDLGHILEEYIVCNLNGIGLEVTDQQAEIIGFAGHWKGHIDGIVHNVPEAPKTPHLGEIKTHNDEQFTKLKRLGVQKSHPKHYDQMMRYMGGLKLKRALYIAYNKNTSQMHFERIRFDKDRYESLLRKEQEVLLNEYLFPRIGSGKPSWYECKICNHRSVCYGMEDIAKNCRTCGHVDMKDGGVWCCTIQSNKELDYAAQMEGCKAYSKDNKYAI